MSKAGELIDRYVYDVTRRLPQEQRADIDKELRSLIDDMLAARGCGDEPSADDVTAVLKELGSPHGLAAKYRGTQRYLIGPDYFDIYWLVLRIVLAATGFGLVVALIVTSVVTPPQNAFSVAGQTLGGIFSGMVQAFAFVTIVFALIDRFGKKAPGIDWSPSDLPPVPPVNQRDAGRINRADPIAGLIFGAIGLVLFNAMPWIFGYVTAVEGMVSVPVFNLEALKTLLPLIDVLIGLGMLKDMIRLLAGRYTMRVSVSIALINVTQLVLNIVIFLPPAIWNAGFASALSAATGVDFFNSQGVQAFWTLLPTVVVVLATIGFVTDTATALYRGAREMRRGEAAA